MMLSDAALRQIIEEYVSLVRRAGIAVHEARLFGSRAREGSHEWSDIDLCIVSPQFGHDRQEETARLLMLAPSSTLKRIPLDS
jgi:predicted nucleotidyltransferase